MRKRKIASILEMAYHRAKRGEIWNLGLLAERIWGTFDLLVINVIWGLFGRFAKPYSLDSYGSASSKLFLCVLSDIP